MNFALSQRPTDRHPVGLMIVVGLHVLLAGALLSARMVHKAPADIPFVPLTPLDPPKPLEPVKQALPAAQEPVLHPPLVAPPVVDVADLPPDTIVVPPDNRSKPEVIASGGPGVDGTRTEPPRFTARAARIDAGDAQCRPAYPAVAQRAGVTGTTRIRFSVDAMGRIAGSQIVQPSGTTRENRLMDKAAAEALAQCPVQVGTDELGRPTGTTTDVTYVWSLN
jgi:protein TonB